MTFIYGVVGTRKPGADLARETLNELTNFLRTASGRELRNRAPALEELFDRLIKEHAKVLPPQKSVRSIARDFKLLQAEQDIWREGIPYGWLAARFDVSYLPQPDDLPVQARIGIGIHEGFVQVEEACLISDAFFLLLRARDTARQMRSAARRARSRNDIMAYQTFSSLNAAACTYSRLGVLTAAAFVEVFINSVGWNEAEKRRLTPDDEEQLRGTKKGRYLSFEGKLERFPRIIRQDGKSPIIISDPAQLREPFRRFLQDTKQVRDASMALRSRKSGYSESATRVAAACRDVGRGCSCGRARVLVGMLPGSCTT